MEAFLSCLGTFAKSIDSNPSNVSEDHQTLGKNRLHYGESVKA